VTQTLLPKAKGRGRVCAAEVMVCTPAIRAVIRDEKIHQIYSLMQAGKKHGMQTMNDALQMLYMKGEVTLEEALKRSGDPNELLRAVGQPAQPAESGRGAGSRGDPMPANSSEGRQQCRLQLHRPPRHRWGHPDRRDRTPHQGRGLRLPGTGSG
jgi:hypothetical protein